MKQFVVASALMVGLTIPAFPAEKYFVTVDTVGNCSVLEGPPSAGQTALGQTGGYDSKDAAETALKAYRRIQVQRRRRVAPPGGVSGPNSPGAFTGRETRSRAK